MNNLSTFYDTFWNASLAVLARMERRGITLDNDHLAKGLARATDELTTLNKQLQSWATDYCRQKELPELNWNSTTQVCEFLFDYKCFDIPPVTGTKAAAKANRNKKPSSSEAALEYLAAHAASATERENLQRLLDYKTIVKLAQFLEKLPLLTSPADHRLRCSIGPNTDTGRLSCRNPNLQQIPTRNDKYGIRRAFTAAPGKLLVVADYSQLEMYVLAHFLLHELNDDSLARDLSSGDVHTGTAFRIWGNELAELGATHENIKDVAKRYRDNAKTVNYAIPYGKTKHGLGMQIKHADGSSIGPEAAQEILDGYFAAYPGLAELFERWKNEARTTGYVRTLLGRTRPLVDINLPPIERYGKLQPDWRALADERRAVNTPVQGSAADIVTAAMLKTNTVRIPGHEKWYNEALAKTGAQLILQVHDELIFEVPEQHAETAAKEIKNSMENPFSRSLKVPLKADVEIGQSWSECK